MKATCCTLYSTEPNFPPNYMTKSLIFQETYIKLLFQRAQPEDPALSVSPTAVSACSQDKDISLLRKGTGTFLITGESQGRARLHVSVGVRAHVQVCVHACACACMHAPVHCECVCACYTCTGVHGHARIHTRTQKDNPVLPNPITEHRLHFLLRQGTQIMRDI